MEERGTDKEEGTTTAHFDESRAKGASTSMCLASCKTAFGVVRQSLGQSHMLKLAIVEGKDVYSQVVRAEVDGDVRSDTQQTGAQPPVEAGGALVLEERHCSLQAGINVPVRLLILCITTSGLHTKCTSVRALPQPVRFLSKSYSDVSETPVCVPSQHAIASMSSKADLRRRFY